MDYLVKEEQLELKYDPDQGAWTYHIQIPNTKHLKGKWGTLKVAGTVDTYQIESINLFTRTGQDKLISVSNKIRKAINKRGGDTVTVTLFLLIPEEQTTESDLLATFRDAGVVEAFNKLPLAERKNILEEITSLTSEEKQIKKVVTWIDHLRGKE